MISLILHVLLTNGYSTMWSAKLHIGLWNSSHSYLIKTPGKEASKCAGKGNSAVASPTTDSNPDQILLSDETFNVLFRVSFLQFQGMGRVLGVTVHCYYSVAIFRQLDQSWAIRFPCGNLKDDYWISKMTLAWPWTKLFCADQLFCTMIFCNIMYLTFCPKV